MHEWLETMKLDEAWVWYERGLLTADEIFDHYGVSEDTITVTGYQPEECEAIVGSCKHENGQPAH